ncbi:MAG: biotin/lipoyl-containing protein [Thermoanaerobaculia bacterium]
MKYRAKIAGPSGDRSVEVEVQLDPAGVVVSLDGRKARWDVAETPGGGFSILRSDGRQAEAVPRVASAGGMEVRVGAEKVPLELLDELTARAQAVAGKGGYRGSGDVKAAIPGRVLRILSGPGDAVVQGQPVVVLEAMKMENDVRAPRDGVVRSVEVTAGQAVGAGQVLLRLEPLG